MLWGTVPACRHIQVAATKDRRKLERAARQHVHRAAGNSGAGTARTGDHAARQHRLDAAGKYRDIAHDGAGLVSLPPLKTAA